MRIAVVGLGPAGLRTAMLLKEKGATVDAFEASDRIGGRLRTITEDGKPLFEAGGEWIDADHRRTHALAEELGCPLDGKPRPPGLVRFGKETCREEALWPDAAEAVAEFERRSSEACAHLPKKGGSSEAKRLDGTSLAQWLDKCASTPRARWVLEAILRSDEGMDTRAISLLGWLKGYQLYLDREEGAMSAGRFARGTTDFCQRMLEASGVEPRFGSWVLGIRKSGAGAELLVSGAAREATAYDRVVLALPPLATSRIAIDPKLEPIQRTRARFALGSGLAMKISWEFDRKFWLEEGETGSVLDRGPLQQIWDASLSETPVLSAYICGVACTEVPEADTVAWGLDRLASIFPSARERFVRGWASNWVRDPHIACGFSFPRLGYAMAHGDLPASHLGPLHFAGEWTAQWRGFIEGALESAERVAGEVGG